MTTFMKNGVDIYMPEMDRTAELKMERFAEFMDKFPSTSRNIFAASRHQSGAIKPCGDGSFDVKSTELNTEKGLKTRHFRELEVFFRLSDFFVFGGCCPGENEG